MPILSSPDALLILQPPDALLIKLLSTISKQDQAWGTTSNPPDPHWILLLVERIHDVLAQGILFSSIDVGSVSTAAVLPPSVA
eukprot:977166-Pelagomonas_calceolata.AAC.3